MIENWMAEVQKTRRALRSTILETVLNEFDSRITGLNHEKRRQKYRQMAESPFRFFRGSTYLFYYDVSKIPFSFHTPEDKPTWLQGDMHVENFGAFQNSEGEIVYDANDFDEGYMGSYVYDLLRMTVSIALYCEQYGLEDQEERMRAFLQAYYKQLKKFVKGKEDPVTLFYTEENTKGPVRKVLKKLEKRDSARLLEKWTVKEDGSRMFELTEEFTSVSQKEQEKIEAAWQDYIDSLDEADRKKSEFYEIKHIIRKHGSGTASIGLDRYYILIEGKNDCEEELDDIILEMKEVRAPVPAYFMPYNEEFWLKYSHQGERVITTQKAMHHHDDPFLGFVTMEGRHFYVRERSPFKKRVKPEEIENEKEFDKVLDVFGGIAAKIHARADIDIEHSLLDYHSEEEIYKAIGDQYDAFEAQLIFMSCAYKERVKQDYVLFCGWLNTKFT
ncbi:DUF2252 domain-containing protein [Domibacillus enclensis]|uniref:Uncharacterized conserved protein, DUF2252 family n=1 Tax=Domibacillus enclensis TaxID=1017273 RepID=A0A1N6WN70_9BACI|nr:DUF2252 family protein [Domibacillus enclensis]OXS77990.1 hypothetical protein B1B05_10315 [Domibacillus enclensis]SIQ91554.1 Uncharacterized conserved protein, DUF2252 family [Domibacillus enclensis]